MTHTPTKNSETGIDWPETEPVRTIRHKRYSKVAREAIQAFCEAAAQIALSRQSAVGGDWEKDWLGWEMELLDKSGHPNDFLDGELGRSVILYSDAVDLVRRALSATRTTEGDQPASSMEWDGPNHLLVTYTDGRTTRFELPTPRPTATGGITVEDVNEIIDGVREWGDDCLGPQEMAEEIKKSLVRLIERAGEQETPNTEGE